jgi:hypothetical protein
MVLLEQNLHSCIPEDPGEAPGLLGLCAYKSKTGLGLIDALLYQ